MGAAHSGSEAERARIREEATQVALETVAGGGPLTRVLEALCRTMEDESLDRVIACIHSVNEDATMFRDTAAPSLDKSYREATEGILVSSMIGPCCYAAATRQTVVVPDVAADPKWVKFQEFAEPLGIRSCWSTPIFSNEGKVLGTFAHYYFEARDPSPRDERMVELLTRAAAVAIERSRTEAALRELNETLEQRVQAETRGRLQIWNVSQDLLAIADLDGKILSVNPAWTVTLGWSEADLLGESYQWLLHVDDRERTRAELDQLAKGHKTLHFENRLRAKDGSYHWISWTAAPDGGRIYGTGRDVTDHKRAELLLAVEKRSLEMISSGARFDEILNYLCNSIDALASGPISTVLMMDPGGHQLWHVAGPRVPRGWLPAIMPRTIGPREGCCGAAAYRKERVIVADVLTHPNWNDSYRRLAVENGIRAAWSEPLLTKDGEVLGTFALYSAQPGVPTAAEIELIEAASHIALIAMVQHRSQSALRKSEEALRESERRLRSTIDGIPGLVAILAPNGEVEAVNRQIFEYTGQSLEELRNWGTNGTVHDEDLPHVIDVFTKSITSGIPYQIEQRLRRFDGEYRWFDNRGIPIRDDSGRIARWYVLLTDIEDRTRALTRLQQMQSDFAHMNRVSMMGELAASLSHEITQPIASARNNARAAMNFMDRQPPDLREAKEAIGCVVGDADRAGDIIDRIREHIRKAPPRKDYFDLNASISQVIVLARNAIIRNSIAVQTGLAEGLSPVYGDCVQLQQVVLNLVLNAVEAMGSAETGARELRISTEQDHSGARVAVRDSGPGIDSTLLDRVFEAFYTTKSSGTGMGLAICRSIIDAHGGRLWADANEPQGAVFQFTLPAVEMES